MALLCSVQAAIRKPALIPNLTQIVDSVYAQAAMNSAAYQPDIQLRAVVQAYADVLMDPTVGDPGSPSIVVPTLKFADV
eukprot:SM010184S09159  [mRNA]  locus=s10184:2:406:- [translate_table: standard]